MAIVVVKPARESDVQGLLERAAPAKLRAWLDQRPAGEYEAWAATRVRRVYSGAFQVYAQPIADRALAILRQKHVSLLDAVRAFALLDSVQGGPSRVFTHEEWDLGVDTWAAALRKAAEHPERVREFYNQGGSLNYWPPAVPDGTYFSDLHRLAQALREGSESTYADPLKGLRTGNVMEVPHFTTLAPPGSPDRSPFAMSCALRFHIEKGQTSDKLRLLLYPLFDKSLSRVRPREISTHGYAEPASPDFHQWSLFSGLDEARYASAGHAGYWADTPITYSLPLTEDTLTLTRTRALSGLVQRALVDAGYKPLSKDIGWSTKGSRAFTAFSGYIDGLRHPAGVRRE